MFFAERGFDVTGVDIARSGLSKAERLACVRGVRVRWVRGDIGGLGTRRVVDGRFDLIYSCGAIHYVPRTVRGRLFLRLKALTREHGLHAHIVFTDRAVQDGTIHRHSVEEFVARAPRGSGGPPWNVARIARVFDVAAGTLLTRAGEPGDEGFLIIDGTARAEVSAEKHVPLHPGEFFGEMSLLDGGRGLRPSSRTPRSAFL